MAREGVGAGCGGVWVVRTEMQPTEEKGEIVLTCSWAANGRPCSGPNTFPLRLVPPFWKCLALSPQGSPLPAPPTLRMGTLDGNSRPFPLAAASPDLGVGQSSLSSRGSRTLPSEGCLSSQLACSGAPLQRSTSPPTPHQQLLTSPAPPGQLLEASPGEDWPWSKFNSLNPPNLPASSHPGTRAG